MQSIVPPLPLSGLLSTVADRLHELGGLTDRIQDQLSPLILQMEAGDGAVRDLQACDRLSQELHALSGFLTGVAGLLPAGWCVDPSAPVAMLTLSTLAGRLSQAGSPQAREQELIEFF